MWHLGVLVRLGAVCQLLSCSATQRVPPPRRVLGRGQGWPCPTGGLVLGLPAGPVLAAPNETAQILPAHQPGGPEPFSCLGAGIKAAETQHKLQLENGRSSVHLLPLKGFQLV